MVEYLNKNHTLEVYPDLFRLNMRCLKIFETVSKFRRFVSKLWRPILDYNFIRPWVLTMKIKAIYWSKIVFFFIAHCIRRPCWGGVPVGILPSRLVGKIRMVWISDGKENFEDMCNCSDTIPACYGQTGGQTSCHGMHTCPAVKNAWSWSRFAFTV